MANEDGTRAAWYRARPTRAGGSFPAAMTRKIEFYVAVARRPPGTLLGKDPGNRLVVERSASASLVPSLNWRAARRASKPNKSQAGSFLSGTGG
jgi:hypothetical protein